MFVHVTFDTGWYFVVAAFFSIEYRERERVYVLSLVLLSLLLLAFSLQFHFYLTITIMLMIFHIGLESFVHPFARSARPLTHTLPPDPSSIVCYPFFPSAISSRSLCVVSIQCVCVDFTSLRISLVKALNESPQQIFFTDTNNFYWTILSAD